MTAVNGWQLHSSQNNTKLWNTYNFAAARSTSIDTVLSFKSIVSCPDPTLSWGKGSGDYGTVSWLCWVNSLDFGQSNEIVPRHPSVRINQWNKPYIMQARNQHSFKIYTAELAQPRKRSIVTDPFPCERAGSGHETIKSGGGGGSPNNQHAGIFLRFGCCYRNKFIHQKNCRSLGW